MKIASSSASFARALAAGELTQLEWLDMCANELEVDAVVFDAAHFPRSDDDYLAQLKKTAVDLGLAVAALDADDLFSDGGERRLDVARALGAPLVICRAARSDDDPAAWGAFASIVKTRTSAAKRMNVTLALRNAVGTLCATTADVKRIAKDVDSAWLRFASDSSDFGTADDGATLLPKAVIAIHRIAQLETFGFPEDAEAAELIARLARFRGCAVLETGDAPATRDAYHRALERFASRRAGALATV